MSKLKVSLFRGLLLIVLCLIFASIHDFPLFLIGLAGFCLVSFVPVAKPLIVANMKDSKLGEDLAPPIEMQILQENFLIAFICSTLGSFGIYYTLLQGFPLWIPAIGIMIGLTIRMLLNTYEVMLIIASTLNEFSDKDYIQMLNKVVAKTRQDVDLESVLHEYRHEEYQQSEIPKWPNPYLLPERVPTKQQFSSKIVKPRKTHRYASSNEAMKKRGK